MGDRERDMEEGNEALDPGLLYTKEYCIGMRRPCAPEAAPR